MHATASIRRRLQIALLCAMSLLAVIANRADAAEVADPAVPGPLGAVRAEYNLPAVQAGLDGATTAVRPAGDIFYPATGAGPFPVLVFMHGNHSTCTSGPEAESGLIAGPSIFADYANGGCTTGSPQIDAALSVDAARSYRGYDYLAELLAGQGYIVASMDVNDITAWSENGNAPGYMGRVEMMSKTFDLISAWNVSNGPAGIDDSLIGRADLSSVGVMGHSRGGEAVNLFAVYNSQRPANATEAASQGIPDFGPRYPLKAVFSLAPVDGQGDFEPEFANTAFATALPYCDGDVYNLQGAPVFERNKQALSDAGHPAIQYLVGGANHNYFNTVWANDDAQLFNFGDPECVAPAGPTRLSKADERDVGVALIGGFLRRYVGGETQFDPIVTGEGIPASACPATEVPIVGVTCRNVIKTSYVAPAPDREVLIAPVGPDVPAATEAGDPITLEGFQSAEVCKPVDQLVTTTGCGGTPNRSPVEQLSLSWSGPAAITVDLEGEREDVTDLATLNFRVGVNFSDPLNPPEVEPVVEVTLTDGAGATSTVSSDDFGGALEAPAGTASRKEVLNGVRIPLNAFAGVDLADVDEIELGFGEGTPTGAIELADLVLQEPAAGSDDDSPPTTTPSDPTAPGPIADGPVADPDDPSAAKPVVCVVRRLHSRGRQAAGKPHKLRERCVISLRQRAARVPFVLARHGVEVDSGIVRPNEKHQVRIRIHGVDRGRYTLTIGRGEHLKRRAISVRQDLSA